MDLSTTKGRFIAVGVAVGATCASLVAYTALTRKSKRRRKKILSKEDLCRVFDNLLDELTAALKRIAQQERIIRQNYAQAGKPVTMDQMYKFCQQRLEEEMAIHEPQIYTKHNTTEAAVAAGAKKHGDDPEVKKKIETFEKMAMAVRKPEIKIKLSEEQLIELFSEMMESINKAMEKTVDSVKQAGHDTKGPEFQAALQSTFNPAVQLISQGCMTKFGITDEEFTATCEKYQNSSAFSSTMKKLTAEQQARFKAIGVSDA